MKKIFAAVAIAFFAMSAFNAQAQNSLYNEATVIEAQNATVVDPLIADFSTVSFEAPSQAQSLAFAPVADESGVPGKGMRTTGKIMTAAGFTVGAAFGAYAVYLANHEVDDAGSAVGDIIGAGLSTEIALCSAAVGVVGVVLWAVGSKRVKNFEASKSGAGIAFNF